MSEEKHGSEILGALPRTRPQRRSDKRPPRADVNTRAARPEAAGPAEPAASPQQPAGTSRQPAGTSRAGTPRAGAPRAGTSRLSARATRAPSKPIAKAGPRRIAQPAQPGGSPRGAGARGEAGVAGQRPAAPRSPGRDPVSSVVHTAAEVAELGLNLSTRAIRGALSRLPRP